MLVFDCLVIVLRLFNTIKVITSAVGQPINMVPGQASWAVNQY